MTEKKIKDINIAAYLKAVQELNASKRELMDSIEEMEGHVVRLEKVEVKPLKQYSDVLSLFNSTLDVSEKIGRCFMEDIKLSIHKPSIQHMEEALLQLPKAMQQAFPSQADSPVLSMMLKEAKLKSFENTTELKLFFTEIIIRFLYSEGPIKVYDLVDGDYFDLTALNDLANRGMVPDVNWMDQFVYCLSTKNIEEVWHLMSITPQKQNLSLNRIYSELYGLCLHEVLNA